MKSEIRYSTDEPVPYYPILKQYEGNGFVVLFDAPGRGVVVKEGLWDLGVYQTTWSESHFVPFTGQVVLSN